MSNNKEPDHPIPDTIVDEGTKTTYVKGRYFGKGGFAKCYEIKKITNGKIYAGKIVSKQLLVKSNHREKMSQEISIHKTLNHKHVVGFHGFFEDKHFVYIVLELCRRRSMMELYKRRQILTEPETRYYMKQILDGVSYLHNNGIIHRDLKLGNLFLNENVEVKIGDFGLATKIEFEGQRKMTVCGTPNYIAPEIITKTGHSFEVDVWSIGCIMYTLLVGKPPFETESLRETYARIKRGDYKIPSTLDDKATKMIHSMLHSDPKRRPTVRALMNMDFMTKGYLPPQLPVSCLSMAPRFDALQIRNNKVAQRKPLLEVNELENSPINKVSTKPVPGATAKPYGNNIGENGFPLSSPTTTTAQCTENLTKLYSQLKDTLRKRPATIPSNLEDLSDPAAQPLVWISKWVDYSDKYGFGYQLCDEGVGVVFNDSTKLILLANGIDVHYIERDGSEQYYTMNKTPPTLDKKMKLLSYFNRYMSEHLVKGGAGLQLQEADQLSRIPHLHQWHRTTSAVVMQLTNGTLQINFMDHTKLILCPLMGAVTYIDAKQNFRTFRFTTVAEFGCTPDLHKSLDYALNKVNLLLQNKTATNCV
ncbi:unnamed protein product [Bemisia tabaci]|uniref:polo kinase n=1 Tax=Bemisia tabaci TaxID=7038 RepID=A0A9P0CBC1_BEMTA|nr:PREDICTED: serine/threonine-protein kinase polo isoform X2 [Bemisia tabaci]CAH0768880.1 unnamed protein product [Bemisia tabaci]